MEDQDGERSMAEIGHSSMAGPCNGEAGQVEEWQMRKAPGTNVKPAETAGDWKHERLEADYLLRSLHQAHTEDEKHRKWLLRRWPEWPREDLSDSVTDPERFIPECYIRDGEDDVSESLQSIKNLLRGGFGLLQGEDDEGGQVDVPGKVTKLSDEGVAEALPLLLPRLKRKALHSILSTLSGRRREARNRPWLIEKITKEWMSFAGHSEGSTSLETLKKILAVVRDPNSFRQEAVSGQLLLEEASCPWSAARSALTETQLEQLPLRCLQVMLEVLLEKPPEVIVGKLPVGGNKERIVTALLGKGRVFLSYEQEGEALPEPLRKSLVVLSVSARYAFGDDGNLISFLDPLPLETTLLQGNLLSALSYLKSLNYKNLQLVHRALIGRPPKLYRKRHPGNFSHSIKKVLLDCLLRSEVRSVPEEVKTAAVTIGTLAREQPGGHKQPGTDSGLKVTVGNDARIELEIESTLRISSHLLQIMYNWNEVLSDRSSKEQERQRIPSGSDIGDYNLVHGIGTLGATEITLDGTRSTKDATLVREESLAATMTDGNEGDDQDTIIRLDGDSSDETAQLAEASRTLDATEITATICPGTGIRSSIDAIQVREESLAAHMGDGNNGDDEDMITQLGSDSFYDTAQAPPTNWTIAMMTDKLDDREDVDINENPGEAMEDWHLTRIADEAAEVAYALVGCAMERTARSSGVSLKRPIRKYLRTGTKRKVRAGPGEGADVEEHQLAMILKIAEKIPAISPRVMDNVKRRLGMG